LNRQISVKGLALGKSVRALREARDLTQESLADRVGVSANYVGDAEKLGKGKR
jgi:transcriptional regulator with XRE-family HTH domain